MATFKVFSNVLHSNVSRDRVQIFRNLSKITTGPIQLFVGTFYFFLPVDSWQKVKHNFHKIRKKSHNEFISRPILSDRLIKTFLSKSWTRDKSPIRQASQSSLSFMVFGSLSFPSRCEIIIELRTEGRDFGPSVIARPPGSEPARGDSSSNSYWLIIGARWDNSDVRSSSVTGVSDWLDDGPQLHRPHPGSPDPDDLNRHPPHWVILMPDQIKNQLFYRKIYFSNIFSFLWTIMGSILLL